jgi:hypothetical protein
VTKGRDEDEDEEAAPADEESPLGVGALPSSLPRVRAHEVAPQPWPEWDEVPKTQVRVCVLILLNSFATCAHTHKHALVSAQLLRLTNI